MTVSPDLDRRFREAASTLGLVDIGYDLVESPIGELLVAASDRGVASIWFDPDPAEDLERLARIGGPRVLRSPRSVDRARRELDEYFAGQRRTFDLDLDLRALPPFTLEVLGELARVPYGETTTYGALAQRVGHPRAARAVGTVMNRNRIPIVLPCHRVVGANGSLTGYAGGLDRKETLLELEGARSVATAGRRRSQRSSRRRCAEVQGAVFCCARSDQSRLRALVRPESACRGPQPASTCARSARTCARPCRRGSGTHHPLGACPEDHGPIEEEVEWREHEHPDEVPLPVRPLEQVVEEHRAGGQRGVDERDGERDQQEQLGVEEPDG